MTSSRLPVAGFTLLVGATSFLGFHSASPAGGQESPSQATIESLIKQLDDDSFKTREAAFKELLEIGLPALPQLQAASNSP